MATNFIDRRSFVEGLARFGVATTVFPTVLYAMAEQHKDITKTMIADAAAVAYFDRIGRWPDVVFVPTGVWNAATAPGVQRDSDPLLFDLARTYRVAEVSDQTGFTVLVRR